MTEKTATFGIRLNRGDKEKLSKILTRKAVEGLLGQIERGEVVLTEKGVSVNTIPNYCDGCEYIENALDMSKFNEVCEYKGMDRQKTLDKCAQMLWK